MYSKTLLICTTLLSFSCNSNSEAKNIDKTLKKEEEILSKYYPSIGAIPLPQNYTRSDTSSGTFAYWLRNIHLKKDKTVYQYNGKRKWNQSAQFAVLDISVGDKDLQQCADAVMRLRAEYLYSNKKFAAITFKDNNGTAYKFTEPFTREHFNKYLERVFGMCGSASLSKELKSIPVSDIQAGDVFIRGGFPGHAVLVVDVAKNDKGQKVYMLAQSYMPAQDIHILNNPADDDLSPWYEVNDDDQIQTPEYVFTNKELKRWQ
ncbi:DUF4846 domain-containing protein [Ferruginibacter sp. SUN002]|uniref:DUF4846 domain-containing protein n=1 Tax=Ferruginibacter sp. SUN002 TaxID=2937789 RepID=UPI003D35FB30